MIVIIDYGMGNVGSIRNMLKKVGAQVTVSGNPQDVAKADKLILPGVGAFDTGMKHLHESGLVEVLNDHALNRKTPVLGICLGMQLLTRRSEEGELPGLGWIDGETVRFRFDGEHAALKVPHMGWNTVTVERPRSVFKDADEESRFYFVHSYHVVCRDEEVLARTRYGVDFTSAVQRDNIVGTQFHPEKSHKFGMRLLKNFVEGA